MRGAIARIIVVLAALVGTLAVGSGGAAAADGVSLSSSTVYRLDPGRPAVVVETTYRMTNVTPDRSLGGGRYEYYFFTGLAVPIDVSAEEITVEVNGRDGSFTVEEENGFPYLDISLGYELRYQKSATIVVRSVLLGDPPRDPDTWVRVNPAYASFEVFGWGDDGQVDIRIETPEEWTTEYVGNVLAERVEDGVRIHEAGGLSNVLEWGVLFTARNDDLLDTSDVRVGDAEFEIRSWPGDTIWLGFASEQIRDGVPVLEEVLGTSWPVDGRTEVIEASTPYLSGYAGFYDSVDDVIEIGEELDRPTFLHELAHAWVNGEGFVDRWIIEGLAEEIAARAAVRLGDEPPEPRTDAELRADGIEFEPFELNTWTRSAADGDEDYGYAASARVLRSLHEEIGDDAFTALLAALLGGERAYPDEEGPVVEPARRVGWEEFLDLAEQVGGSERLEERYRDDIVTRSQAATLDRRNEVLIEYDRLVERGGSWHPPAGLREDMAAWQWSLAERWIVDAATLLDERDSLWDALAPIGLSSPGDLERSYQDEAGDFDELHATIASLIENAAALVGARAELAEALTPIGQAVPELTQAEYEAGPEEALDATEELTADALELAARLDVLDAALDEHDLEVPPLDEDAFVVDRQGAFSLVDDRIEAATAVDALHDDRDEVTSLVERIGLWRSDVDDRIDEVDALLADGDTDAALTAAAATAGDIDDLDTVGVRRLGAAVGGLLLLVVLITAVVLLRRRGRAHSDDVDGSADRIDVFAPPTVGATPAQRPGTIAGTDHHDGRVVDVGHVTAAPGDGSRPAFAGHADPAESQDGTSDHPAGEADAGEAGPVDPHD